jgi:glutamate synthase (NADPH/NADH) large chain
MFSLEPSQVLRRGRLGPGQMIALDLKEGRFYEDLAIKDMLAGEHPYLEWTRRIVDLEPIIGPGPEPRMFDDGQLQTRQRAAGYSLEDIELILHPMIADGKEAIGSMGDDTPLAVLSQHYRPLSHFFRQNFSQVTNPPIDSLREDRVMSLKTRFRNLGNVLAQDEKQADVFVLETPIISNGMYQRIRDHLTGKFKEIDCVFPLTRGMAEGEALEQAIAHIRAAAEQAVRDGFSHLILTDERIAPDRAPIPMILATGAVHSHLLRNGLRNEVSINVRAADCLDTHYAAVLIGVGATTVNAYLAQDIVADRHARGLYGDLTLGQCVKRYLDAMSAGLLKIISKMGISVISSYRGGYNFEALGLSRSMVADIFPGMSSRISGIGFSGIAARVARLHRAALEEDVLPVGGFYRARAAGEAHGDSAMLIHLLQSAVQKNSYGLYKKYSEGADSQAPLSLRHLMNFRLPAEPAPLDEVEPAENIFARFVTPGMSLGALSPEAHKTLNIAMNRIGARSNSGEGGEEPDHFGTEANSQVKQIASGRFGVTAEYLNACREIEIKVAQGAKPGEGGQLPGFKVTEMIARLRHAVPGTTLISPPPHHDIYSIEDLAQLIYDLKQINPDARVCVKLVSASGVGTIASGVAKAKADIIHIAGHSGGTGASPQSSIKFAGLPWEAGLSEANQILTMNGLRERVTLRTDGGLRTGRDIVMAALLGAEEYAIGTASLVAMGCLLVRQCHSNTCPVGVCTQDESLRAKFAGTPEKVINLFHFIAEEVREVLSSLGARSLGEVIRRTDLLYQKSRGSADLDELDLNSLLCVADTRGSRVSTRKQRNAVLPTLDTDIVESAMAALKRGEKVEMAFEVRNTQRSIGARLSSAMVRKWGLMGLAPDSVTLRLYGSCGQSLGAFGVRGLRIDVEGDANDYVGKGLSGATIVLKPPRAARFTASDNTIIGNTVLYGATSGFLFAAGQAGERFAVRNSGAVCVVEGCGSNGCEYMTGGTAVILGTPGDNFAAGMTGGIAYVYDADGTFEQHINPDSVTWRRLGGEAELHDLWAWIRRHKEATRSRLAETLLSEQSAQKFWVVIPNGRVWRGSLPAERTAQPKSRRALVH